MTRVTPYYLREILSPPDYDIQNLTSTELRKFRGSGGIPFNDPRGRCIDDVRNRSCDLYEYYVHIRPFRLSFISHRFCLYSHMIETPSTCLLKSVGTYSSESKSERIERYLEDYEEFSQFINDMMTESYEHYPVFTDMIQSSFVNHGFISLFYRGIFDAIKEIQQCMAIVESLPYCITAKYDEDYPPLPQSYAQLRDEYENYDDDFDHHEGMDF